LRIGSCVCMQAAAAAERLKCASHSSLAPSLVLALFHSSIVLLQERIAELEDAARFRFSDVLKTVSKACCLPHSHRPSRCSLTLCQALSHSDPALSHSDTALSLFLAFSPLVLLQERIAEQEGAAMGDKPWHLS
jgi:hypothetical protein